MNQIELWSIETASIGITATPVISVNSAQTEALLEELFVKSPHLLEEELTLIGRQVPTDGGPLDLLAIDEDGRLVVFELKRGMLTRDAIAQAVDYASDLADSDAERITRLVQDYSGRLGIDKIDDFEDWYAENFPNSAGVLSHPPRIVLVGLGADERARRMVNYLADAGVDIQLLMFSGFDLAGKLLLAKQVESISPARPTRQFQASPTKQANLKVLRDSAESLGVLDLLEDVAEFVTKHVPAYQYPGKTAYTFSLAERTSEGNPSLRSYVRVDLNQKKRAVTMILVSRALQACATAIDNFQRKFPSDVVLNQKHQQLEILLTRETWPRFAGELALVLDAMVVGWEEKSTMENGISTLPVAIERQEGTGTVPAAPCRGLRDREEEPVPPEQLVRSELL